MEDYAVELRSLTTVNEDSGLIPRLLRDIIDAVQQRHGEGETKTARMKLRRWMGDNCARAVLFL
jgi:hypothetical protein